VSTTQPGNLLFPKTPRPIKPRLSLRRLTPLKRGTKPLRRSPLPRRSSPLKKRAAPDPAVFRDADVRAVFGTCPRCPLTGEQKAVDRHHVLGRGQLFGMRPGDPRRHVFGSVYNCAVLDRAVHKSGYRDHPYVRALLLEIAAEKVREVVVSGRYVVSARDAEFLAFARSWLAACGL
jgi:hypothetical protein